MVMLPVGVHCPGCEDEEKEYFVTSGSKGSIFFVYNDLDAVDVL